MIDVGDQVRRYVEGQFLVTFGEEITGDTDLFERQVIDSFGFVELVAFLEKTFAIRISDDDLLSNRLTTLDGMTALVRERIDAGAG